MFPFILCLWVGWCSCYAIALFLLWYHLSFYLVVTSRLTIWRSCLSISYIPFFFWALLDSIPAGPAHFVPWASLAHFIPWASSAHFILPYLFHSHGFLLNLLGFPDPITTSLPFGLIGFCANPMNLLIPFLDLPNPFYFLSISYNSHEFTTSFLGFLGPFAFFLATYYFCGLVDHHSYHSGLMVFILLFSVSISFILLGFFCHWALLSKVGINNY